MTLENASAEFVLDGLFRQEPAPLLPASDAPLVIYGAGSCGREALGILRNEGYQILAFLDQAPGPSHAVDGIPCYAPTNPRVRQLAQSGVPALMAVFNFLTDPGVIVERLRAMGFAAVFPYPALAATFPGSLRSPFWLAPRHFWEEHRPAMERALSVWADDCSRRLFLEHVELRLTGNPSLLRNPDRSSQYFPPGLPMPREPMRLIDGGAFTGDTIGVACQRFALEGVAAFEPDAQNFSYLRERLSTLSSACRDVVLFPCGLDSQARRVRFQEGQGAGSGISGSGTSWIQTVALDDALPNFAPTFLKLDIEGAEPEALRGATNTISRFRPRMAVCLYHRPEHLWEIPLLLRELAPEHRLFLRQHGFNGFDAVAYAIEP